MNDYNKGDMKVFYTGDYYFNPNGRATTFTGTTGDDKMWIAGEESTVYSSSGNDIVSLVGYSGSNVVYTGAGNDFVGTNYNNNYTIFGGKGNDTIRLRVSRTYAAGEDDDDLFVLLNGANSVTCDGGAGGDEFWFIESINNVSIKGGAGNDTYNFDPYYMFGPYHNDVVISDLSSGDVIRYFEDKSDGSGLSYYKDSSGDIVLRDDDNGVFTITLQGVTDISQVADVKYRSYYSTKTLGEIFKVTADPDPDPDPDPEPDPESDPDPDEPVYDDQLYFNDEETAVELLESYEEDSFDASDYEELKSIDGSAVTNDIEIYGNDLGNSIVGGNGNDTLYGSGGNDTLKGGNGKDVFVYSEGNDVITDYTAGKDTIKIESGSIKKAALSGSNVILTVDSGKITVKNAKSKKITIVDEDDNSFTTIISATASTSSSSKVTLSNTDDSIFTAESTTVTIDASKRSKAIKITGNSKANKIYGGKMKDTLYGGSGNDLIKGNAGADKLFGDAGNDTLYGGAAADTLSGGAGNDKLYGDAGNDSLAGGAGADTLSGGAGNDTLKGEAGKDVFLFDGQGKDVITDYTANQDKIVFTDEDVSIASIKGSDVIFILESGSSINVKKGKGKNITIVDTNGDEMTEKYTTTTYFNDEDDEDEDEDYDDDEMYYVERPWFAEDNNFAADDLSSLLDGTVKDISNVSQDNKSTALTTNLIQYVNDLTTMTKED